MSTRRLWILALSTIGFCAMPASGAAQIARPSQTVVRQVDHLLLSSSHPKKLFALFTETFQLPVAWPMLDHGGFTSGGVALGNVNLEILQSREPTEVTAVRPGSRVIGIALEPAPLQVCLPELDKRQIAHGAPAPFRSRKLTEAFKVLWTTVALPELSSDDLEIFFCEYSHDQTARRQSLLEQLQSRGGGPLSVHSVQAIVCGARDPKQSQERWQKLLQPLQPSSPGRWPIGPGPAVHVIKAEQDGIQELIINLASLDQARRFLREYHLLGADQPTALTVSVPLLQGLTLTLVEQPPDKPPGDSTAD